MTTAHRPTFDAARGKTNASAPTRQYSSRSLPAHKILKYRSTVQSKVPGQATANLEELKRDLLLAETAHFTSKPGGNHEIQHKRQILGEAYESIAPPENGIAAKRRRVTAQGQIKDVHFDNKNQVKRESDVKTEGESYGDGKTEEETQGAGAAAADDEDEDDDDDDDDDDDEEDEDEDDDNSDDDDDEDDAAELMRELEKIKAERAAERRAKELELAAEEQAKREEEIAFSNPLMNATGDDFLLHKRWDQDVVFRVKEQKADAKKDFVNDLLRSDFHRSFMKKYIK